MQNNLIAKASITINKPRSTVWDAFVNPKIIKQYMFGTNVISNWKEGSSILWHGEYEGKPYEDKGVILKIDPERVLQYSHFSPLSGVLDLPENYHVITVELVEEDDKTRVNFTQDNNPTDEDQQHSESMWKMMLAALKKVLEA